MKPKTPTLKQLEARFPGWKIVADKNSAGWFCHPPRTTDAILQHPVRDRRVMLRYGTFAEQRRMMWALLEAYEKEGVK